MNEIQMLKLKIKRDESARSALSKVSFSSCPSCLMALPEKKPDHCIVCGQESNAEISQESIEILEKDADNRIKELADSLTDHNSQLMKMRLKRESFKKTKCKIDDELDKLLAEYDSAYLSTVIDTEKELITVNEKIASLRKIQELPSKANQLQNDADRMTPDILEKKNELNEAREKAEKDTRNLKLLEKIFLRMLMQVNFPGIKDEDYVSMSSPDFLPNVIDSRSGDLAVTSFSNLSSGGKKTIFKSCFALAIHYLARKTNNSLLPTFMIIDSPMKNISERENQEVFESFVKFIYTLASEIMEGTQFILIDKEYYPPQEEYEFSHMSRHMQPDSEEYPPLIPYYKGH